MHTKQAKLLDGFAETIFIRAALQFSYEIPLIFTVACDF